MIYSHFYRHNSFCTVFWVSSFYLSVNIVLYQFTVTCIEDWSVRSLWQWIIESKIYILSMLGRKKKKVQDCDYVFGSSTKFQRRMNGFVKADICRQVSVCLHVFCGILFALKPFCDYSLCSVCILPQPAFYSQSVVCILHSVCILPLVRSLQSAVRSLLLHWPCSESRCAERSTFRARFFFVSAILLLILTLNFSHRV